MPCGVEYGDCGESASVRSFPSAVWCRCCKKALPQSMADVSHPQPTLALPQHRWRAGAFGTGEHALLNHGQMADSDCSGGLQPASLIIDP